MSHFADPKCLNRENRAKLQNLTWRHCEMSLLCLLMKAWCLVCVHENMLAAELHNFPALLFNCYIDTSYMHGEPLSALSIRTHRRRTVVLWHVIVFASCYSSSQQMRTCVLKYESVSVRTRLWSQNNVWTTQWSAPGWPQDERACVVKCWCLWLIVTWK